MPLGSRSTTSEAQREINSLQFARAEFDQARVRAKLAPDAVERLVDRVASILVTQAQRGLFERPGVQPMRGERAKVACRHVLEQRRSAGLHRLGHDWGRDIVNQFFEAHAGAHASDPAVRWMLFARVPVAAH